MAINSISFMLFFILVFALYYSLHKIQHIILLVASAFLICCYKVEYLFVMLGVGTISYIFGLCLGKHKKKVIVLLGVIANIVTLFVFKYLNFAYGIVQRIERYVFHIDIEINDAFFDIILPVGISYYIFQCISYIVDVYREKTGCEKNWFFFMLYLGYFPKFVMGPIEKAGDLLPQLKTIHKFDYEEAVKGLITLLVGLFKKIAVADVLAVAVNNVFNNSHNYTGLALIIATALYAIQIYCDFSGYTDMAIGVSRVLGIRLVDNFRCPYLSRSITEFWRRWHISLSSWLRDYIYIPLGGNRVRLLRYLINTLITMTLSGVWHGASMNFVIWGALNGILLCIEKLCIKVDKNDMDKINIKGILKIVVTFMFICCTWVFFRTANFDEAIYIFSNAFRGIEFSVEYIGNSLYRMGFDWFYLILAIVVLLILLVIDILEYKQKLCDRLRNKKTVVRWSIYIALTVIVIACKIYTAASQQFIYFNF